jgi:hypothetical protein
MYWSAAFWTMGRTVVEPLILIVCLSPGVDGAAIAAGAAGGTAGAEPAVVRIAAGVGTVTCVATGFGAPVSVQPANSSAQMSSAARPAVMDKQDILLDFMVFYHPFHGGYYTLFRHKLYEYIY